MSPSNADRTSTLSDHGKRPIGVWVVSVGYMVVTIWSARLAALFYFNRPQLPPAEDQYFRSIGTLDYAIWVGGFLLTVTATVSLFRLRKLAVTLFGVGLICAGIYSAIQAVTTNYLEMLGDGKGLSALLPLLVQLALYRYAWGLRERGVLR